MGLTSCEKLTENADINNAWSSRDLRVTLARSSRTLAWNSRYPRARVTFCAAIQVQTSTTSLSTISCAFFDELFMFLEQIDTDISHIILIKKYCRVCIFQTEPKLVCFDWHRWRILKTLFSMSPLTLFILPSVLHATRTSICTKTTTHHFLANVATKLRDESNTFWLIIVAPFIGTICGPNTNQG